MIFTGKRKIKPEGLDYKRVKQKDGYYTATYKDGKQIGKKKWHGSNYKAFIETAREKELLPSKKETYRTLADAQESGQQNILVPSGNRYLLIVKVSTKEHPVFFSSIEYFRRDLSETDKLYIYQKVKNKYQRVSDIKITHIELVQTIDQMALVGSNRRVKPVGRRMRAVYPIR